MWEEWISLILSPLFDSPEGKCYKCRSEVCTQTKPFTGGHKGKLLVDCTMYTDMLKVPSLLSFSLQEDGMGIIQGIKNILKSSASLESLS